MDAPKPTQQKKPFPFTIVFFVVLSIGLIAFAALSVQPRAEGQPATGGWQTIPRNELPPQK